jgi:quercetin dioxygenase-like cupin family protein
MELSAPKPSTFEICYPEGLPNSFPVDLFAPIDGTALAIREQKLKDKVDALQAFMLEQPQADIPVRNVFSGGVYAREVFIPKGTMLVGKVHMTEHLNVCLQGDLTFLTVDGPKRIKAPAMFSSPAGTKKLAYANEDSIWVNVHPDLGTDADTIVDAITVNTFAEYDKLVGKASFTQAIEHFGFTEDSVREASEDESTLDRTPLFGVEVRSSSIEGQGLFATQSYASGQILCPATLNNKRSLAGRYSNHSGVPNCMFDYVDNILVLVALRDIESGEELTTDYGATLAAIASRNKE